jgi:predicted permease
MTRHWLFSVAVVLLLGLGASVAIVILSFADAVLFRRLPVPRPEELVRVVQELPRAGIMSSVPEAYYDNLRARTGALAFVFGETGEFDHFAVTSPLPAERISVRGVTPDFFTGLGVQPRDGRLFNDSDSVPSSQYAPALLSDRLWQRRFAGTQGPPALGRDIIVNDQHFTIVGIMPADFRGLTTDTTPDLWIPLSAFKSLVKHVDQPLRFQLAARLKSGLSLKQAEVECQTVWQSTMTEYYRNIERVPEKDVAELVGRVVHLESLERGVSVLRNSFKTVLETVLVASLFLLLAVCLTVGGLFTIRAVSRRLEFAVRYSLGASRLGLLRQLWIEGLLFAGAGGALGVIVAVMCLPLAERLLPVLRDRSGALLPLTLAVTIDRPVVLIAGAGVLLASVVFLALTATGVSRANLEVGLRSVRATTGSRGRSIIVTLQVAVCTLLLLMAGVFVRTLMQLRDVAAGFDKDSVATFTGDSSLPVNLDAPLLPQLLDRVRALPGVTSASISSVAVMRGRGVAWTVAPAGETITPAHLLATVGNTVSMDYVETMGMRVVQGRSFSVSDRDALQPDSAVPALVNQAFATRFFPNGNPLGQYFGPPANGLGSSRYVIVGVVSDAKYRSLREPIPLTFLALGWPSGAFVLNVRTSSAPRMILEPVQKVLASINPSLSFREVHTLDAEVDASMANERLMAAVVSTFAVCAAIAAVAGIYGLMAYLAALRRREIAIRMALGATGVNIVQLMTRETLVVVLAGIVIGLAASRAVAPVLQPMLFNTSATSPVTAVVTATVVLVATFVATAGPIGRVARLAPAQVLRE